MAPPSQGCPHRLSRLGHRHGSWEGHTSWQEAAQVQPKDQCALQSKKTRYEINPNFSDSLVTTNCFPHLIFSPFLLQQ